MSELKKQQVECSFFESAFKTAVCATIFLDDYLAGVKNGKHTAAVERLRGYLAAHDAEHAESTKKRLPLLVAGGVMEGGRKLEHMVRYSQCVPIDLDDVPGSALDFLHQAEALDYVKAGHVSPSGTGDKLFVLVDSSLADHQSAFGYVSRMIEHDLPGVKVDISGKDANRGCFAGYDPEAFYKEESRVVHIPVEELKAEKQQAASAVRPSGHVTGQPVKTTLSNYIDRFESDNSFMDGGRHSYLVKLASALNSAGFAEYEVESECLRRYSEPGFPEKEIRSIVADIYQRYRGAHGSNPWTPPVPPSRPASLSSLTSLTPLPENPASEELSPMGFDIEPDEACLPHFDKVVLDRLPGLLLDVLKTSGDEREYDLMAISSITMLSTVLPGVSGMLKKTPYKPPFYTLIVGESGSGKGCISMLHKLVDYWQEYVLNNSKALVKEAKKEKEAYELYKAQQRTGKAKLPAGPVPEEPEPVYEKRLHMSGYTSTARMIEQLEINKPYASLLFETELESVNNTMMQDFGGYGYVLNQAFHHERINCSSRTNGTSFVEAPELGFLATGTPAMLQKLIPSTESGLYSRLLIYRIAGRTDYQPLTSSDDTMSCVHYFNNLGLRVLDMAVHLEKSHTFVSFSDKQRKRLDRYFEREYYNVRVFGNSDVTSVVLRHRLIIFRIAMTLTGIRKGESRSMEEDIEISDDDFEIAYHIGTRCLRHSLLVSTSLKHSDADQHHKLLDAQVGLFDAMPDEFKTAEVLTEASVRGISRASVFRMLKNAQLYGLVELVSIGCYRKTEKGKHVKN